MGYPNPLTNWGNEDLLMTDEARQSVADASPRAFRVLDWPALRDEFESHDASANSAKKSFNRHGVTGASLSAVGASLLAVISPVPSGTAQSALSVFGCGLVLFGALMGVWHLIGHSGRSRWLLARLWTERLRQFYFQYLINHFEASVAAMGDDAKLAAYRLSRDGALRTFVEGLSNNISARGFLRAIRWLANDHADMEAWTQDNWQTNEALPGTAMTDDHRELFECLSQRRIGIQEIYAQSNLRPDHATQGNMAHRVVVWGNIATAVFVSSLTLAGLWILVRQGQDALPSDILISISGIAAAWGLYFRLADQGMGYSLDTERYELYADQVDLVRRRFTAAANDVHGKIAALRLLEIYAYRELQQFLRTHLRSRFLG